MRPTEEGPDPSEIEVLQVGIAEFAVTDNGQPFACYGLGSCVAIGMYEPATPIGGLAHVMLPSSAEIDGGPDAKFADTGCRRLLAELRGLGARIDQVEAKIAGGSEMFQFEGIASEVGKRNVASVKATLAELNVSIIDEDIGGNHGRSIMFDTTTGEMSITTADGSATSI